MSISLLLGAIVAAAYGIWWAAIPLLAAGVIIASVETRPDRTDPARRPISQRTLRRLNERLDEEQR